MKKGDIYIVTLGSEQSKTRPCVIISTNIVNDYAKTVTIAPLSTKKRDKPFIFHIPYGESIIKLEQLRTVDKKRLIKKIGTISKGCENQIKKILALYFDI
jgi:mRNA interferase MazF